MVEYQDFVTLCGSSDSEERGQAAHLAATAYLGHTGPSDEHAALYAALIGFLDDPSARVRGALAYGLLHAREAPRSVLLALLQDSDVIARAIAQHSPALIDADIFGLVTAADAPMLSALAQRETISPRIAEALVARGDRPVILKLLGRRDIDLAAVTLAKLATESGGTDPEMRGALLSRADLPADLRLNLVEAAAAALRNCRIVSGAIAPKRLDRVLRDGFDTALTSIGEDQARQGGGAYAAALVGSARISPRVMLHAVVNGHVLFFADCLAELSGSPREKVFTLLETGSRVALNALLGRCGMSAPVRNLICRLIAHARTADLADDVAARHFVVTALTEELIVEHDGEIPQELEEAFRYLSDQNVALARRAARGVMSAFADGDAGRMMTAVPREERLALPAA